MVVGSQNLRGLGLVNEPRLQLLLKGQHFGQTQVFIYIMNDYF